MIDPNVHLAMCDAEFAAGRASRDAEVAELKLEIDQAKLATPALDAIGVVAPSPRLLMEGYRRVLEARHEEKTKELREQVKLLRDALTFYALKSTKADVAGMALSATEPKP